MNGNWPGADGISTDASTGRGQWDVPGHRRAGLRSLHRFNRYGLVLRAPSARPLGERIDPRIGNRAEVARCLNDPAFIGLIALRGDEIRFEACADDFDGRQVHSIQSISKMAVNLLAARCLSRRLIDLQRRTADYLPQIGGGYADATVRQLLDMNVVNGYVEDYTDPDSDVGKLECAHGWRIGTSNRSGSRFGPRQIRSESCLVRPYGMATGAAPFDSFQVADIGDVALNSFSLSESIGIITAFYRRLAKTGAWPVTLGGDHAITLPILRALHETHGAVALVHVDAHADTNDAMFGEPVTHGTIMRRAIEEGLVDPQRMVQIGLRRFGDECPHGIANEFAARHFLQ